MSQLNETTSGHLSNGSQTAEFYMAANGMSAPKATVGFYKQQQLDEMDRLDIMAQRHISKGQLPTKARSAQQTRTMYSRNGTSFEVPKDPYCFYSNLDKEENDLMIITGGGNVNFDRKFTYGQMECARVITRQIWTPKVQRLRNAAAKREVILGVCFSFLERIDTSLKQTALMKSLPMRALERTTPAHSPALDVKHASCLPLPVDIMYETVSVLPSPVVQTSVAIELPSPVVQSPTALLLPSPVVVEPTPDITTDKPLPLPVEECLHADAISVTTSEAEPPKESQTPAYQSYHDIKKHSQYTDIRRTTSHQRLTHHIRTTQRHERMKKQYHIPQVDYMQEKVEGLSKEIITIPMTVKQALETRSVAFERGSPALYRAEAFFTRKTEDDIYTRALNKMFTWTSGLTASAILRSKERRISELYRRVREEEVEENIAIFNLRRQQDTPPKPKKTQEKEWFRIQLPPPKHGINGHEPVHPHQQPHYLTTLKAKSMPLNIYTIRKHNREVEAARNRVRDWIEMCDLAKRQVPHLVKKAAQAHQAQEKREAHADIEEPTQTKEQNVTFSDDRETVTEEVFITPQKETSATADTMQEASWSIKNMMAKPYPLARREWSTGDPAGKKLSTFMIPEDILATKYFTKLIERFTFFRGHPHIRIQLNGTKFHNGLLCFIWRHRYSQQQDQQQLYDYRTALAGPHILLDASYSNSGILKIPFVHEFSFFDPNNKSQEFLGSLDVIVINPLKAVNASSTTISYTVWGSIDDCELHQPSYNIDTRFMKSLPEEEPSRFTVFEKAKPAAQAGIEGFAKSALAAAGGPTGAIAGAAMNLDKPSDPIDITRFVPNTVTALNYGDGIDRGTRLSLYPGSITAQDQGTSGTSVSELNLRSLISLPGIVRQLDWNAAQTSGTELGTIMLTPTLCADNQAIGNAQMYSPTMLAWYSRMYRFWRGSLKMKVQLVASVMHSGRLAVVLKMFRRGSSFDDDIMLQSLVLDLQEQSVIEFDVPYMSTLPWMRADRFTSYIESADIGATTIGEMTVYVLNQLVHPDSATPNVQLNVYMSAGEDFALAVPCDLYCADGIGVVQTEKDEKKQAHSLTTPETLTSRTDNSSLTLSKGNQKLRGMSFPIMGEDFMDLKTVLRRYTLMFKGRYWNGSDDYEEAFITIPNTPTASPAARILKVGDTWMAQTAKTYLAHASEPFTFWVGSLNYKIIWTKIEGAGTMQITHIPDTYAPLSPLFAPYVDKQTTTTAQLAHAQASFGTMFIDLQRQSSAEFSVPFYTRFNVLRTENIGSTRCMTGHIKINIDTQAKFNFNYEVYQAAGDEFDLKIIRAPPKIRMLWEQFRNLEGQLEEYSQCPTPRIVTKLFGIHPAHDPDRYGEWKKSGESQSIEKRVTSVEKKVTGMIDPLRDALLLGTQANKKIDGVQTAFSGHIHYLANDPNGELEMITSTPKPNNSTKPQAHGFVDWLPKMPKLQVVEKLEKVADRISDALTPDSETGPIAQVTAMLQAFLEKTKGFPSVFQKIGVDLKSDFTHWIVNIATITTAITSFMYCTNPISRTLALVTLVGALVNVAETTVKNKLMHLCTEVCSWFSGESTEEENDCKKPEEQSRKPEAQAGMETIVSSASVIGPFAAGISIAVGFLALSRLPNTKEIGEVCKNISERLRLFNFSVLAMSNLQKFYDMIKDSVNWIIEWVVSKTNPEMLAQLALMEGFDKVEEWVAEIDEIGQDNFTDKCLYDHDYRKRVLKLVDQGEKYRALLAKGKFGREAAFIKEYAMRALEIGKLVTAAQYTYPVRANPFCVSLFGESGVGKSGCVTSMAMYILNMLGYPLHNRWCAVNCNEQFFTENYNNQAAVYFDDFSQMTTEEQYNNFFNLKSNNSIPLNLAFNKGRCFNSDFIFMTTNTAYPAPNCITKKEALLNRRDALIEVDFTDEWTKEAHRNGRDVRRPDFSHARFRMLHSSEPTRPKGPWLSFEEMTVSLAAMAQAHLTTQYQKTIRELQLMSYILDPPKEFKVSEDEINKMIIGLHNVRIDMWEKDQEDARILGQIASEDPEAPVRISNALTKLRTLQEKEWRARNPTPTRAPSIRSNASSEARTAQVGEEDDTDTHYDTASDDTESTHSTGTNPFSQYDPKNPFSGDEEFKLDTLSKYFAFHNTPQFLPFLPGNVEPLRQEEEEEKEKEPEKEKPKKKKNLGRRIIKKIFSWTPRQMKLDPELVKADDFLETMRPDFLERLEHNGVLYSLPKKEGESDEAYSELMTEWTLGENIAQMANDPPPAGFRLMLEQSDMDMTAVWFQYHLWKASRPTKQSTTWKFITRLTTKAKDIKQGLTDRIKSFIENHPTLAKAIDVFILILCLFGILIITNIIVWKVSKKCPCGIIRWLGFRCGLCGRWPKLTGKASHTDWLKTEWKNLYGDQPYIENHITTIEEEIAIKKAQREQIPEKPVTGTKEAHARYSSNDTRGAVTRSRIANSLLETGDQGVHDLIGVLKPATYRIRTWIDDKRAVSMNALAFHGRKLLVPTHFFTACKDGEVMEIYYDGAWMPVNNLPRRRTVIPNKDITVFEMPEQFHQHKSLLRHFITEDDLAYCQLTPVSLLVRDKSLDIITTFGCAKAENEVDYESTLDGETEEILVQRAWMYTNIPVEKGYCGSPLIAHHTRITGRLLGLHVCGTSHAGWATLLTREMIAPFCSGTQLGTPQPKAHSNIGNLIPEGHFGLGGTVSPKEMVIQPANTQIVPTAIHGEITPPVTFPSVLSAKDPRLLEPMSPLRNGISKYGQISPEIPEQYTEIILEDMREEVDRWPRAKEPTVLTVEEAVLGFPKLEGYEKLPLDTSPGWPYTMTRPPNEKGKAYLFNEDGSIKDNDLRTRLEQRIRMAERGERVVSVWTDCLKDERRTLEKIQKGKTRLFTIPPVDYSIMVRMYTMDFLVSMRSARKQSFSQVGIDCQSPEWNFLYKRLAAKSPYVIAGDYTAFDGTQNPQQIRAFYQLIYYYHTQTTDTTKDPKLWNVLMTIAEESTHTTHLAKDQIWISHKGNKSGDPVTVDKNCFVGSFNSRLAWLIASKEHSPEHHNLQSYHQHVEEVNYGDDDLKAVKLEVLDWYNQDIISEILKRFNITYTNSAKTGTTAYMKLDDATFLKQGFKTHETIHTLKVPTMAKDTIYELLNWTRKAPDEDELLESNCQDSLRFAYFYGREFFNQLRGDICNALKKRGKSFRVPTFMDYELWFYHKANMM